MSKLSELHLGFFEKYLAIWVLACMMIGLALSQVFPQLSNAINESSIFRNINPNRCFTLPDDVSSTLKPTV